MTIKATEESFKIILKNKENEHRIDSKVLENLLRNLRKFIKETEKKHFKEKKIINLDVIALPASSFGIEFSVSTQKFDLDGDLKTIIDTLNNTIIDVTTADSEKLYDLIFKTQRYSPPQLGAFVTFAEEVLSSGYDLIVESKDEENKIKSNKITTNQVVKIHKVNKVLDKQFINHKDTITFDGQVMSVSLIKNHVSITSNQPYTISSPLDPSTKITLFSKNTRLNGVVSDKIKNALMKHERSIPVPSNITCEIALEGKIDLIEKKFSATKITILEFKEKH